jgi:hypothetical protein
MRARFNEHNGYKLTQLQIIGNGYQFCFRRQSQEVKKIIIHNKLYSKEF